MTLEKPKTAVQRCKFWGREARQKFLGLNFHYEQNKINKIIKIKMVTAPRLFYAKIQLTSCKINQ